MTTDEDEGQNIVNADVRSSTDPDPARRWPLDVRGRMIDTFPFSGAPRQLAVEANPQEERSRHGPENHPRQSETLSGVVDRLCKILCPFEFLL